MEQYIIRKNYYEEIDICAELIRKSFVLAAAEN